MPILHSVRQWGEEHYQEIAPDDIQNQNCTKVAARRLVKVLASDLFFFEKQW